MQQNSSKKLELFTTSAFAAVCKRVLLKKKSVTSLFLHGVVFRVIVDTEDGAHTQNIERTWRSAKWRNKKHFGTHRQMIDSYLCEFLWREDAKRREVDEFEDILTKIVDFMHPK